MRKVLLAVMTVSTLFDVGVVAMIFFRPELEAAQFGITPTADTQFLGNLVGWLTLFFTAICGLSAWRLWRDQALGGTLAIFAGVFLVGMGAGLYAHLGLAQFLAMDTLRGAAMIGLGCALPRRVPG